MQDGIIKGAGNSRYIKGPPNAGTLWPIYEDFISALAAGQVTIDLAGVNPNGWSQQGMPLNKGNLLTDAVANALALTGDKTPAQAFEKLRQLAGTAQSMADGALNRKHSSYGSYSGTGSLSRTIYGLHSGYHFIIIFGAFPTNLRGSMAAIVKPFDGYAYSDESSGGYEVHHATKNFAVSYTDTSVTLSGNRDFHAMNTSSRTYYYAAF